MPQLASYLRAIGCRAAISSDRITARLANGPGLPAAPARGTFPSSSFPQFSQYSSRLRYNDNANYSITTVPYRSVYTVYIVYTELLRQRSAADENFQLSNASGQCDKSFGYLATKDAKKYRVYLLYIKV